MTTCHRAVRRHQTSGGNPDLPEADFTNAGAHCGVKAGALCWIEIGVGSGYNIMVCFALTDA